MAAHPNLAAVKDGPLDGSLTNLTWLQSLNVMNLGAPTPPITPDPPHDYVAKAGLKVNPNQALGTSYLPAATTTAVASDGYYGAYGQRMLPGLPSLEKIDYKTNHLVKPPYSYATLICMAMADSKKTKITLAAIYNWITENFMYYRMADPSWQNSIRHNLSLNKCFEKVPRRKDEPGKGGFWRINPQYSDLLENGMFKKRRGSDRGVGQCCGAAAAGAPFGGGGGGRRSRKESDEPSPDCTASKRKRKAAAAADRLQQHLRRHHQALDDDDDANTLSLGDDVTFNALLRQDIEISGVRMKAEDLIDDRDGEIADSLLALSPSASDDDDDSSAADNFDELLRAHLTDLSASSSADGTGGGAGDHIGGGGASGYGLGSLSVQGVRIEPPEWWAESLGASGFRGALHGSQLGGRGLHTPPPPASSSPPPRGGGGHHHHHASSSVAEAHHPWSTNRSELDEAIAALDMDTIFGMHD